jgi:AraC-like DNA-binding protein
VRQRLSRPLSFFGYGSAERASLPISLVQSLRLVDSLLDPHGNVPSALRLDDLITRQLVLMIAPELLDPHDEGPAQSSAASFEQLLEWIISRLDQPLSLSELELRSGYSRRALQRAFQSRFGCGPMQWVRQRRLVQALEQLTQADGNTSVSAIAKRCGYLSLSSFSRDFSKAYGRTPSEVLRANRGWG